MKKFILIAFLIVFLASCGPHRMSCGARGICNASGKQMLDHSKNNHDKQIVKIRQKNPV
jgi:hypothetical protein